MDQFIQFFFTGLSVGLVYALVALGFVVVWKSSDVANLCLGELVLLSAWFTYGMVEQAHLPYYIGLPITIIFSIVLGWLIERFALRPLIAQPILSLICITLGLAYFFRGVIYFVWPFSVAGLPRLFPATPIQLGPAAVSQEYLWAGGISLVLFAGLTLFYRYHKMGIAMRATSDDQLAIQACGVPVTSIFSSCWIIACVVAAVGGILLAQIGGISWGVAESGLKSFAVVILGGLDSFLGAIVAGPIIGLCENIGGGYLSAIAWAGIRDVVPFIIIIIMLFVKPYGLFGEVRIERI